MALLALGLFGCGGSKGTDPAPTGGGAIEGYVFGRSDGSKQAVLADGASRQATPPSGAVALNEAVVTLAPTGRQTTTGADRSGQSGFFRILGLDPGTYAVTVSCPGYVDASFSVAVQAGTTTSAGVSNGQTVLEPSSGAPKRKWTVMVYMDADGDLEEYGILNMNQMESLGSDANVNMVVQFDRGPGFDATNGDWQDTRRYLVTKDSDLQKISSPVLENQGEVDMGNPQSLTDFIKWSVARYPADRYCLVLWNHGAGWRSRSSGQGLSRGIIFDDSGDGVNTNTYLTMGELNDGIAASNVHFDLIALDVSLMGMLEVYYEIRDRADYVTGSEESPPGPGYPYDKILGRLVANPSLTTEDFGRAFVEEQLANYPRDAVTQALIKTSQLVTFGTKVTNLAATLLPLVASNRTQFDLARAQSQSYAYSYYRDLYDFATKLRSNISDPGLESAADEVMNAMLGANGGPVIAESHSATSVDRSHGLSIYLPASSQYYTGYEDLAFVKDHPKWGELIRLITNR